MKLKSNKFHIVFPAYGAEFRDVGGWSAHWQETFCGNYQFWPGISGGGILSIPPSIPGKRITPLVSPHVLCSFNLPRGLVLGNPSGKELNECLRYAVPYMPPTYAVRLGLASRISEPTVKVTAEHADCLDDEQRYLVVVPRTKRRSLKHIEKLPEWFRTFDVTIDVNSAEVPPPLRAAMSDWFDDPGRLMYAFRMSGGQDDAVWQLAVVFYIAEFWDIQSRGLECIHLVSCIDGKPNYRKNWTSNR